MDTKLIIAVAVLVVLLVFYIIAKVKSNKGELVFTANGWDMAMLLACPVALFIAWCWGFDHPLNTVQIVCLIIAGLCLVGTVIMSIVHNQGNPMGIVISIMAKLFVVWLTMVIILLLLVILIVAFIFSVASEHSGGDTILLKYDYFLHAYVGYRVW